MSVERLEQESGRWWRQAADDLEAARYLMDVGKYAQAGFFAQQAGEKALKSLWIRLDLDPWGHSLARLIQQLPAPEREALQPLIRSALYLDKLYIPTRYPDALAELIPGEAYTEEEAAAALDHARALVEAVHALLQGR